MTKIYIECGTTLSTTINTGIQRVVRSIVRESDAVGHEFGLTCIPVAFREGKFYPVSELDKANQVFNPASEELPKPPHISNRRRLLALLLRGLGRLNNTGLFTFPILAQVKKLLSPYVKRLAHLHSDLSHVAQIEISSGRDELSEHEPSEVKPKEILLLLDSTWDPRIWPAVDEFRAAGGHVCAVLYDLIPFSHPETVAEGTRLAHTSWWTAAPNHLDSIMCISSSVRDDYLAWQENTIVDRKIKPENVGYFHLGAELKQNDPVIAVFNSSAPSFLVVGSLEPRKNHFFILDAFDQLWKQKNEINLVIVGGFGWKSEELLSRVQRHPELGRKLFLIRDASDRDLNRLYDKCDALIIASLAEGFGLPIVEAFHHGTAVICSDIPVFREVAGDRASYFDLGSPAALAAQVSKRAQTLTSNPSQRRKNMTAWLSWRESAEQLFNRLLVLADAPREK